MQATPNSMSKNSFIVSFVGMCLLYHGFATCQQFLGLLQTVTC